MKKLTIAFFVELLWRIKHLSIWPYKVWEVPIYHSVTLAALADGYGTMTLSPGKVEKKRLHGRYFTEARARKEIEEASTNAEREDRARKRR